MANCDFSAYTEARNQTAQSANAAQAACAALDAAEAAADDAQRAVEEARAAKDAAYSTWEADEQAENAIAADLGINPVAPPPGPAGRR